MQDGVFCTEQRRGPMGSNKLNFALVGCGRITQKHAEVLTSGAVEKGSLVAVCDVKEERAREYGEKYNIPWFTDMHKMCRDLGDKIDVLSVLSESGYHAKHTIELAQYGKHIIVEKPMALTIPEAEEMIATTQKAGVRLFVVKQNRYNLPVMKLREALEAGRFGKLVMGTVRVRWMRPQSYYDQDAWRGTWKLDGGVLSNQASHHIDLLTWMMGDVNSVFCYSSTRLVNIEADDTACAVLKFNNGALGVVEATTATRPKNLEGSISILGEKGTVEIGGFAVNEIKVWNFDNMRPEEEEEMKLFRENPPNVYGFGHARYLDSVTNIIAEGSGVGVDGAEGLKSLRLIAAMYESMASGHEVALSYRGEGSPLGHERGVLENKAIERLKVVGE